MEPEKYSEPVKYLYSMDGLRKLRKEKGYTLESLGEAVGVKKSAVSKYERGEIHPSRLVLLRMSETLGCSVDFLLGKQDGSADADAEHEPSAVKAGAGLVMRETERLGRRKEPPSFAEDFEGLGEADWEALAEHARALKGTRDEADPRKSTYQKECSAMTVGGNIKAARKAVKITQTELAARSGISRSYLGDLEGDRYNPSVDTLMQIASALDVAAAALLGDGQADAQAPNKRDTALSSFRRSEFMGLTDDEVEALAKVADTLKKTRGRQ